MKIAIIGTRGIPNNYGGFEQLAEFLSVGLVEKGHDVTVYNNHLHPYRGNIFKGVKIRRIYSPEKLIGSAANIIYDFFCLIDAIIKHNEIILECGYQSSAIGFYFLPFRGIKIVTNMDGLDWKRSKWSPWVKKITKWFEKLAIQKSDALIADNMGMKEYLDDTYKVNSFFIPYGTTLPKMFEKIFLEEFDLKPFNYYIIVARLEPENNIEVILDGFLKSKIYKEFIVVGNHQTNYGRALKSKYKDESLIKFVGGIYELDKLNSLRYFAELYFHGHSVGGTNPSLLDAMACKCLVISHDNPFNRNVLGEDAYYFKSREDIEQILKTKFSIEKELICNNNLAKITSIYTWENVVELHEKLFKKLIF